MNYAIFVRMKLLMSMIAFFLVQITTISSTTAQHIFDSTGVKYDTNYIEMYRDDLTTRFIISRKQNCYSLSDRLVNPWLRYKTNDNLLVGLGGTYNFLTLNLAVKMPLFNSDEDLYGKSTYVDLQTHTIFRRFILDLYLQWSKGYYLSDPQRVLTDWTSDQPLPLRGDLRTSLIGLNVQYLFNAERYSYRASFFHNEFQKKSAGSPLVGIEGYWMLGLADSVMVPVTAYGGRFLDDSPFDQSDMANMGINGGYAYTLVWNEALYLSFSSVVGITGGYHRLHHTASSHTSSSGISFGLNNSTRIALGYNSARYYVGLSYIRFSMSSRVGDQRDWISYSTGNIRFHVVRRFRLKRPIRLLRPDLWTF